MPDLRPCFSEIKPFALLGTGKVRHSYIGNDMNYESIIRKADKHHTAMNKVIEPLADKVRDFLDDECADVFHQTDGWVIVYGYMSNNTPVNRIDFKKFFKMTKEDALEYLEKYSI